MMFCIISALVLLLTRSCIGKPRLQMPLHRSALAPHGCVSALFGVQASFPLSVRSALGFFS